MRGGARPGTKEPIQELTERPGSTTAGELTSTPAEAGHEQGGDLKAVGPDAKSVNINCPHLTENVDTQPSDDTRDEIKAQQIRSENERRR